MKRYRISFIIVLISILQLCSRPSVVAGSYCKVPIGINAMILEKKYVLIVSRLLQGWASRRFHKLNSRFSVTFWVQYASAWVDGVTARKRGLKEMLASPKRCAFNLSVGR